MRQLTPVEARKWLEDHNFIELPQGSYFRWLEEEWFNRYKEVLAYKNSAYIPRTDKLKELSLLDEAYKDYQFRTYKSVRDNEEESLPLKPVSETPKEEIKEETYVNGKGEPLPF